MIKQCIVLENDMNEMTVSYRPRDGRSSYKKEDGTEVISDDETFLIDILRHDFNNITHEITVRKISTFLSPGDAQDMIAFLNAYLEVENASKEAGE